jgi:hypothetical protein
MIKRWVIICLFFFTPGTSVAQQNGDAWHSLGSARFSRQEIEQLIAVVEELSYDTPESWREELRAKRVSLGSTSGIVLQGKHLLCGATGNCQIFVFRKMNGNWISLFKDSAPLAESFKFEAQTSYGINDLTISANLGAEHSKSVTYRFDGKCYRPQ